VREETTIGGKLSAKAKFAGRAAIAGAAIRTHKACVANTVFCRVAAGDTTRRAVGVARYAGRGPNLCLKMVGGAELAGHCQRRGRPSCVSAVEREVDRLKPALRAEAAIDVKRAFCARHALALLGGRKRVRRRGPAVLCAGRALRHDAADGKGVEGAVFDPVRAGAARARLTERAAEAEVKRQLEDARRAHALEDVGHARQRVA